MSASLVLAQVPSEREGITNMESVECFESILDNESTRRRMTCVFSFFPLHAQRSAATAFTFASHNNIRHREVYLSENALDEISLT